MLIVGDKEIESGKVSVRSRDKGELGTILVETFIRILPKKLKKQ